MTRYLDPGSKWDVATLRVIFRNRKAVVRATNTTSTSADRLPGEGLSSGEWCHFPFARRTFCHWYHRHLPIPNRPGTWPSVSQRETNYMLQGSHYQEQQLLVGGHFLPFPAHRGSEERGLFLQGTLASAGSKPWAHSPPPARPSKCPSSSPLPLPLLLLKLELFFSVPLDSKKLSHEAHDSAIPHGSQDSKHSTAQCRQGVAETKPNLSFSFP